jgi:O-acetyl-ADP-ribose deacetylase (regulator of RNase III)
MELIYVTGDATQPKGDEYKVIAHICNNVGGWGAGFVLSLSKRWKQPEKAYRSWYANGATVNDVLFRLGETQFVRVSPKVHVANMIAQDGIRRDRINKRLVDYEALGKCMNTVKNFATADIHQEVSIHMPRIGVGLGGGSWDIIESIIDHAFDETEVFVYVYDLPNRR